MGGVKRVLGTVEPWRKVARRSLGLSLMDRDTAERARALRMWRLVLLSSSEASVMGRITNEADFDTSLRDTVGGKATSTLLLRARPLLRFMQWSLENHLVFLPITEGFVYRYLVELREHMAATFPATVIEALNFAGGVFGVEGALEATSSPRVKGLVAAERSKKRVLRQAKPLSVENVASLELAVQNDEGDMLDRLFAGHCLFVLYARARWSDAML
eukprot:5269356-Amphidinium_carterae.1